MTTAASIVRQALAIVLTIVMFGHAASVRAQSTADHRSRNFLIHTDLPEDEAKELLSDLETMLSIISRYWAAPSRKPIECFVVRDHRNFSAAVLPPQGRAAVANGGVTIAQGIRRRSSVSMTAKVYASSKYGTALHEAVHAYCYQTFGRTGPTWYAEGMAEMGNYWQKDDATVTAPNYVIGFLRRSRRKSTAEITDNGQRTGDGWQNYAWRWALCHFLANNPNYRDRFRQLGVSLLAGKNASFDRSFASMLEELNFEFQLFVDHLNQGVNVQKTAWDWKARYRSQRQGRPVTAKLKADHGWQSSSLLVKKGEVYRCTPSGQWKTSDETEVDFSDGQNGPDRLYAAVFDDYELSKPIELDSPTFVAPADGKLVLRCRDEWHKLDDNSGTITVSLTRDSDGE